jgi:hypothetical protein
VDGRVKRGHDARDRPRTIPGEAIQENMRGARHAGGLLLHFKWERPHLLNGPFEQFCHVEIIPLFGAAAEAKSALPLRAATVASRHPNDSYRYSTRKLALVDKRNAFVCQIQAPAIIGRAVRAKRAGNPNHNGGQFPTERV